MPPVNEKAPVDSSPAAAAPLDVVTQALGEATVADNATVDAPQEADSPEPAQSSSANDGEKSPDKAEEKDLLSVVRDAVQGKDTSKKDDASKDPEKKPDGEDVSSTSKQAEKQDAKSDNADDADPTNEELEGYKPKTRKQIEKLLRQRHERDEQIEQLRPQAEQFGKIEDFRKEYGLKAEDIAQAMVLTAMFVNDPVKAREELAKRLDLLDQAIGNKLPDDLQKKVEDGTLDQEAALEVSRNRAAVKRSEALRAQTEERVEAERQQAQTTAVKTQIKGELDKWQAGTAKTDPDYQRKAPLLDKYIRAMVAEKGQPATPQDAIAMADAAYKRVNQDIAGFKPAPAAAPQTQQPQPKRMLQSRHTSGTQRPAPSSPLDVVRQAVSGAK